MAKKQNLSYQDIETSLEVLKERRIHSSEVGYVILKAFGKSDADIVDSCYPGYPFANDEERLECLFRMYEKMTSK